MPTNFKVISRNIKSLHKPNPAFPVSSVISPYPPWESTTPYHSLLSQHAIQSQTSSCLCLCSSDLVFSHRERRNQVFRVCGNAFCGYHLTVPEEWFLLPVSSHSASMSQAWVLDENVLVSMYVGLVNHLPYNMAPSSLYLPVGLASGPEHHSAGLSHIGLEVWEFLLVQQLL